MNEKLKVLDLFSGIGGFSLGLERTGGFETVAFCEIDDYCRKVLAKHWPDVPFHKDIRELTADAVGPVDIIVGGYPCQPFSVAGKRGGTDDDRHLWPEMYRLVAALRPTWVIAENVAGHINMGLDQVLSDLEAEDYTCWPLVIPACAVDAPHRRDRVWIVANNDSQRSGASGTSKIQRTPTIKTTATSKQSLLMANANSKRSNGGATEQRAGRREKSTGGNFIPDPDYPGCQQQRRIEPVQAEHVTVKRCCRWFPEPGVDRVAHGIPHRVDQLRALGNAVVPQIPEIIGHAILKAEGVKL